MHFRFYDAQSTLIPERAGVITLYTSCAEELQGNRQTAQKFIECLTHPQNRFFRPRFLVVTEDEGQNAKVAGFVFYESLTAMAPAFNLGGLCVDPVHRKQGIGTELIRRALGEIKKELFCMGEPEGLVLLEQGQKSSTKMYKNLGFRTSFNRGSKPRYPGQPLRRYMSLTLLNSGQAP